MPRFSWRGLTPQLFAIIILPITILLLAIAFGGIYFHRQAMRNLVGQRDERAARAAASALREQLNHRAAAVQGLALRVAPDSSSRMLSNILTESDFLLPDFDGGLAFLSPDGEILASIGDQALWDNFRISEQGKLTIPGTPQTPPTFLPFPHPETGEDMMLAIEPVPQTGMFASGAFSPAILARSALSNVFAPGAGAAAFVVNQDFRLLFKTGSLLPDVDLRSHPGIRSALAGESGATFLEVDGEEHVIAFSPVSPIGWALVIEEPWEAVTSPLLTATENAPLVLIPILLLAVVALWFGTRRIVQPLQELESKAAELAWGDYESIEKPVGGIAEIRRLQSELIHLAHKVKAAQQSLRGYIGAITAGQEEERHRLARELHDDTLQSLIALNQRVQLARLSLDGDQEDQTETLAEIQKLTEETIQNLRRVTRALRPIYLEDLGLVAALEMLAREMHQESDVTVEFRKTGSERRLSENAELALFRIAQEALSNIIRHAGASQADVRLRFDQESVRLEVIDDGRGFEVPESPAEFAPGGHFGLLGMHERAELIGAQLIIDSSPREGTRVKLDLPYEVIRED